MATAGETLADRLRVALADHESLHEKNMFGGRAFMVNEKLLVSVGGHGDLLVRVDPERTEALLGVDGARVAEMGGRSMGPSWLLVGPEAVSTNADLTFWVDVALAYNETLTGRGPSRRRR